MPHFIVFCFAAFYKYFIYVTNERFVSFKRRHPLKGTTHKNLALNLGSSGGTAAQSMPVSYRVRLNCREEVTADVLERARELESEVEPEDMTKLQHSHDKTLMDEELLCMDDLGSTAGEEAVKIVGTTTKD